MTKQANATFKINSWDEDPYDQIDGAPKLTRAQVKKTFQGESTLQYLMMYRDDGTANFVGLERVVGTLDGRKGSFVLRHIGSFEGGIAKSDWFVVSGSGTKELTGLRGRGSFAGGHAETHKVTLDFDFE